MALFLVGAAVFLSFSGIGQARGSSRDIGILGGPASLLYEEGELPAAISTPSPLGPSTGALSEVEDPLDAPQGSLVAMLEAGSESGPSRDGGVISYIVKKGDTLSGIGADFGITVQTIVNANPNARSSALQIGQELAILPVSGITYVTQEGETIESIAAAFNLKPSEIKNFNRSVNFGALESGATLVIPGARSMVAVRGGKTLPDLKGYLIQPTQGFNWGKLHERNAVDIANTCGTEVVASQEGLVVDEGADGWNSGYGHYVLIEHPNGIKTQYAHLQSVLAALGDYVTQGQTIGAIGNTGNVHGTTGCHLHFEVEGAQNPFAK